MFIIWCGYDFKFISPSFVIMITDSCSCEKGAYGCKGFSRRCQTTWCLACDRNRVKRQCQSESLYQEGDPLKELNWCCDRGCELINRSSKFSPMKKTELEVNEKKIYYFEDNELEAGDNCYGHHRKHHSKSIKEKIDLGVSTQLQNSYCEISLGPEKTKSHKFKKYLNPNPEQNKSHQINYNDSKILQYQIIEDNHNVLFPCKTLDSVEKEKSSELKEIYLKEMEILRSKLSFLKDGMACDGKRLRQRSESEPGFSELPGGVPKRARDNSPKMKMAHRKLSKSPNLNHSLQQLSAKQGIPFQRESKSLSPSSIKTVDKKCIHGNELSKKLLSIKREVEKLTTNENQEYTTKHNHNDYRKDTDDGNGSDVDEDDGNESLASNITSSSSGSNTPSKVGECLKSITLEEETQYSTNTLKCQNKDVEVVPDVDVTSKNNMIERKELFRSSLFPNVPPYVKFFMHDFKGPTLPTDIRRHLKWRLSSITPIIIRRTLLNSGFKLVRSELIKESNDWTGQWGKHMKSFVFKTLKDFQKLNHFPGTFQIGRKDRLWKNLYRLMVKFGKKEFGFIPKTFILPHDRKLLRTAWEKATGPGKGQWIVKPPAAARGTGIKVVHRWGQIPKKKSLIVQKYIAQPYLINGSKFDLRLYVLMTSIHPLRIYLYDDGLVRFASVKYSDDVECLSNRFMHLTNYSINKLSNQYQVNADASSCHGHKWSLKSLWTYLAKEGVNVKTLRKNLTDLVIKTIISGESNINMLSKNNLPSRYCSYELFGIDVLLDHTLKPWLLEVNISPSLHSASPLDLAVKGPLVKELLNIVGFQIPAKLTKEQENGFLDNLGLKDEIHTLCYDRRLYWMNLSKEEKAKQEVFHNLSRKEYLNSILENLTPDDVRHLIQFEDELTQLYRFEKIFPTSHTHVYHQFFESPRYYNMMLDAWETKYHKNRAEGIGLLSSLCQDKVHLNVPDTITSSPDLKDSSNQELLAEEKNDSREERESDIDHEQDHGKKASAVISAAKIPFLNAMTPSKKLSSNDSFQLPKSSKSSTKSPKHSKTSIILAPKKSPTTAVAESYGEDEVLDGVKDETITTVLRAEEGHRVPLKETCLKVLTEMRQNGLKFVSDSKQDKLKQFSNCKLENSILNESLNGGKSVLSPTKHIHNACIKMNTTS